MVPFRTGFDLSNHAGVRSVDPGPPPILGRRSWAMGKPLLSIGRYAADSNWVSYAGVGLEQKT